MVTGFIITSHVSDKLRPEGNFYLKRNIESILSFCKHEFKIIVIDNESQYDLDLPKNDMRIIYHRIDDQIKEGLTGAWNLGLRLAYQNQCDIFINCNDDLWFNDTINNFISLVKHSNNVDMIFAPVSNGILPPSRQRSEGPYDGNYILDCKTGANTINGFCFAMTKKHYEKFKINETEYFDRYNKHNGGGDGKWGGEEGQFIVNSEKGLHALVVTECFVSHDKIRGWKQLKVPGTGTSINRNEYEQKYL